MFFFNRKKLIEINDKLDKLLSINASNEERLHHIEDNLFGLENRVNNLEKNVIENGKRDTEMLGDSIGGIQKELKSEIVGLISQVEETKKLLLKSKEQLFNDIMQLVDNMNSSMDAIIQMIQTVNDKGDDRQKVIIADIEDRFYLLGQSVKLLLMNSIMEQIDEE